jgi:hypothetical protein
MAIGWAKSRLPDAAHIKGVDRGEKVICCGGWRRVYLIHRSGGISSGYNMANLRWQTLVIAIQTLDAEMQKMRAECDACDGPGLPDLQELLLDYTRAAADLKAAYRDIYTPNSNLPTYAALVVSADGAQQ